MIVKLTFNPDLNIGLIWSKSGKVLFRAYKPEDVELAKQLLTIEKVPSEIELATAKLEGRDPVVETVLAEKTYFQAQWRKGVCVLTKRVQGYTW